MPAFPPIATPVPTPPDSPLLRIVVRDSRDKIANEMARSRRQKSNQQ
jgi:hypothetical protein